MLEHFRLIKAFIKEVLPKKAPIIPISAIFNANVDYLAQKIEELIPTPEFDANADFFSISPDHLM